MPGAGTEKTNDQLLLPGLPRQHNQGFCFGGGGHGRQIAEPHMAMWAGDIRVTLWP